MEFVTPLTIFIALLGGILPSVFWLWFWLKEDKLHPEPRGMIILAFLAGMLATALAYPIEKFIGEHFQSTDPASQLSLFTLWSMTEEVLKFLGIYVIAISSKYFDEPIDAVVYFMTVALGFAALENAMFLFNPLGDGDALATLLLGNFRFIGATLLHVGASGFMGIMVALSFYEVRSKKILLTSIGLIGAIALHTLFNFSIIMTEGAYLYQIFLVTWIFIIGILLLCEKIKRLAPRSHVEHPHTGIVINIPNYHT